MASISKRTKRNAVKQVAPKVPRTRKPVEMTLEQWQTALRHEFGREQQFNLKNIGSEPVFSEYVVTNPETKMDYRVAIRGRAPGMNYCSCRDYAVNTLGTCKHIAFALAKIEKRRGGKAALRQGFQPAYTEIYLQYAGERRVIFSPGTQCPPALKRLAAEYFDSEGVLTPEGFSRFDGFMKEAKQLDPDMRIYEDTLAFIAQIRDDNRRRAIISDAFRKGIDSPAFDKLLKVPLYAYQRTGALFAASAGRCLLADDMGLGKTIQALAASEILAGAVGVTRALIICPTSLKHQWKQEIEKFTRRSAEVVEGLLAARQTLYKTDTFFKITNYDVIHRDRELIREWGPDLIILDEAQRIKNWKTRTAQSVKKLESEYAIVLTGTPLENRLEELHSIVEFVDRFCLGPSFRFLAEHQHLDEYGKVVGYRNLSRISQTLAPILLRRRKEEVLKELPERLEKKFFVPMTEQQMEHHSENQDLVATIVKRWRRMGFLTEKDQRILMIALQNMRMSCDSTYLLDKKTDFGVKADELMALLDEIFSGDGEGKAQGEGEGVRGDAAKVVIFSQWTRMHELIMRRFTNGRSWGHVFFHGGVPGKDRRLLIQRFKTDPECRLFLSTDAGGVGLNLQSASVVINMDLPWNPAVLEQRIGRVHRLGQHRPVRVVNFVSQGTIEHGMLNVLQFKKSVFAGVLEGGSDEVFLGGTRLKRFMESVEKSMENTPPSMPASTGADPGAVGEESGAAGDESSAADDRAGAAGEKAGAAGDELGAAGEKADAAGEEPESSIGAKNGEPATESSRAETTMAKTALAEELAESHANELSAPEAVEKATSDSAAIAAQTAAIAGGATAQSSAGASSSPTPATQAAWQDGLKSLLEAGLAFLQKASSSRTPDGTSSSRTPDGNFSESAASSAIKEDTANEPKTSIRTAAFIRQDAQTGEPYLRLPVPAPDILKKAADFINALIGTKS
ncbi:MAG: DEAD/DEAH box helicase [Candidatus Sumerlaeota bacterium]|nr:DEAD/DEAH box helicase [Candidatus Sumerlaeota bacterium]